MHRMRDPDEFSVAVSGARLVADFLAPRTLPTQVEQFQTSGWALDFHEAHVNARVHATLPPGWASLGLMRSPATSTWHGFSGRQGALVCTPPGEIIDGIITPGFQCVSVNVPSVVWEQCRALSGANRAAFGGAVAHYLPPPVFTRIEQRLREVRELLRRASAAPHLAMSATCEAAALAADMVTTAWELSDPASQPRESARNRSRLARRAEAWMRQHLSDPAQVTDLCLALRVSRRELEYAFRTTFDQSPRDYLQALRLNAIRRALLRAEARRDTVIRVALDHGITHLGRFAINYRALFGESPSASLRGVTRERQRA
jgi:AraC family transcriptional regulator, ethanolamine operon transcriptional activator